MKRPSAATVLFGLIALSIVATTAWAFFSAVRQPFYLDEAQEATSGLKFSRIGPRTFHPVAEGDMILSHPLLYTFTHALVQKVFGPSEVPLRAYGVVHFLLSLWLMLLILNFLLRECAPQARKAGLAIAAALYTANPLLIQHSVVINADNNILTTMILLFIYCSLRLDDRTGRRFLYSRLVLAVLLALCYWSKEVAPIFLTMGLLAYRLLKRQFRRFWIDLALVGIAGIVLFWSSWWLYCALTGTDVMGFMRFTVINKSKMAFSSGYLKGVFHMAFYGARWSIYWAGATFFIALGMFVAQRARDFSRRRQLSPVDLVFLYGAAIWLPFQCFRPTIDMVKYQYPSYPLFIVAIAWLCARMLEDSPWSRKREGGATGFFPALAGLVFAALVLHYYALGDYILVLWGSLFKYLNGHFFIYYYLPLVLVLSLAVIITGKGYRRKSAFLVTVCSILPISIGLTINQAKADYLTHEIWLNYGDSGMRQTVDYLLTQVKDGDVVSVREDIEYYLVQRHGLKVRNVIPYKMFAASPEELAAMFFTQPPVKVFVFEKISPGATLNPSVIQLIDTFFTLDRQIGSFHIFKRKQAP